MTQEEQNLYNIVEEAYKRHGTELVNSPFGSTCLFGETDEGLTVLINSEVPFTHHFFNITQEVQDAFVKEGYEIVKAGFFYDYYSIDMKKVEKE